MLRQTYFAFHGLPDTPEAWQRAIESDVTMTEELRQALSRAILLRYSRHKLSIGELNRRSGYEALRRSFELRRACNVEYTSASRAYVSAKQTRFEAFEEQYLKSENMRNEAAVFKYNMENSEKFEWRRTLQRRDSLLLKWLYDITQAVDRHAIPILFIGNGVFGHKHGKGSKPSMGSKHVREVLSRRFVCVLVAEQYTSKKCPSCKLNLEASSGMRGRERRCTSTYCNNAQDFGTSVNGKRRYAGHRDYLACVNILMLALGSLFGYDRPDALQFESDRDDDNDNGEDGGGTQLPAPNLPNPPVSRQS